MFEQINRNQPMCVTEPNLQNEPPLPLQYHVLKSYPFSRPNGPTPTLAELHEAFEKAFRKLTDQASLGQLGFRDVTGDETSGIAHFVKKPPLGLMPRWLFDEKFPDATVLDIEGRLQSVADAMYRYHDAGQEIPKEWTDEYLERSRGFNFTCRQMTEYLASLSADQPLIVQEK